MSHVAGNNDVKAVQPAQKRPRLVLGADNDVKKETVEGTVEGLVEETAEVTVEDVKKWLKEDCQEIIRQATRYLPEGGHGEQKRKKKRKNNSLKLKSCLRF